MGGRTTTEDAEDDGDDDVEKATADLGGEKEEEDEEDVIIAWGEGSVGGRTRPIIAVRRAAALWRVGRRRDTMVTSDFPFSD